MERVIHWFNLVPLKEYLCREALEELITILKDKYPEIPNTRLQRLPAVEQAALSEVSTFQISTGFSDQGATPDERSLLGRYELIFGLCTTEEPFVKNFPEHTELWGVTFDNERALAWRVDDKYIIWHEVLHLLGAEDCYNPVTHEKTCEEKYCLMQYVPTAQNCNKGFYLCEKNEKIISS